MKRINLISRTAICLYLVLALVFVGGCNQSSPKTIEEQSIVVKVTKSNKGHDLKYWVVTDDYNFFTNRVYNIGDTVRLAN